MNRILPKVKWISDKHTKELAGYKRKYKESWIKGICDRRENIIYLNTRITELKHPLFHEIDCLLHEFSHTISRHTKIDGIIDKIGLTIDIYLYNHTNPKYLKRENNANNT